MRRLLLVLCLALAACSSAPQNYPVDVPDPDDVRVTAADGFRLYVDGSCLTVVETRALLSELVQARAWLEGYLGPHMAPASFRGYGVPRALCPDMACPNPIDVVIVRSGDRCHADEHGITVLKRHVARRDATHEMVHYLAGSSWRPVDEGLAVYLTERIWGAEKGVPVKVRARVFLDLNLDVNLYPTTVREGMSRRDYDTAGAFVGWLMEAYPRETFWKLYCGAVRDYHSAYDMGEVELWTRFWRYVRNLDVKKNSAYYRYKAELTR